MFLRLFLTTIFLTFLAACSSINKKDCNKDMRSFGLSQGRAGSPKKQTDSLRKVCSSRNPNIDLQAYEEGFYQGWTEYCLPNKAFEMGKRDESYASFCPPEREELFREKYLIGKRYYELKDSESNIVMKINELRPTITQNSSDLESYNELNKEVESIRRELMQVEAEGRKDSFKFR